MSSFPGKLALASAFLVSLSVSASDLENITVTASRTNASIDDVGSAVTLISREEILNRNANTLADLLRDVPGMAMSQQGGVGTLAQLRMRGAEANHVLVLIDGVEANDIAQDSAFNFSHVLAADIERIEVVRGPQSSLWGSDALAGVVNVVTVPRISDDAKTTLNLESGSHGTVNGSVRASRKFDRWGISGSANHVGTDGTNIARQGNENDGYRNTSVQLAAQAEISANALLTFNWRYVDTTTDFDDIDFLTTGLPIDAPNTTDSQQQYGRVSLSISQQNDIDHILSLTRTDTDNVNHTSAPVDDVTLGTRDSIQWQTNITRGSHTVSLVAEHERNDYEQRGEVSFFGNPNKKLEAHTSSFAGEYRLNADRFDVSASLRHDRNSEFNDANTWRLTGLWHATSSIALFASTGKSVKNPTFTDRFGFYDTFIGNPDLRPEHSRAHEVGLRWRVPTFSLSTSYYTSALHDEINGFAFDTTTGAFTAENIATESDRRGVEVEVGWQPTDALSIDSSYTWLDAEENGLDEIRRAGNNGTLRVNYRLDRLNLNLGLNYNGSQWDNYFPPVPPYQERVQLSSYTLVNIAAQYEVSNNVTLTLRAENLLDESYEEVFGFRGADFAAYAGIRLSL